ncbi:uncharacterized protein KY384_002015 [Bacidia gigantensis]|uniref:uncharacterized protein n=1 Tax=Bacidia gigantensis TaxID=2732470 RepID=UPI001D045B23|nr:uncharacterized protein KY384_002015 [Bacidia gigantensis]KAG8533232.1 hypothetical protein KY384_002015 [Bacidia gigantensis]
MPPARSIRHRVVTNENDENSGTTRLTRAKAASLDTSKDAGDVPVKKALAAKKSAINATNRGLGQKRGALGDISNVSKSEAVDSKEKKKPITAKPGLVSKAQSAGIQKSSQIKPGRPVLGAKDSNQRSNGSDLKRPASGSGVMGNPVKKRNTGSTGSQASLKEEDNLDTENRPPTQNNVEETRKQSSHEIHPQMRDQVKPEPDTDTKGEHKDVVMDLDTEDIDDPLMVAEYVVEIFEYLQQLEETTAPNPSYMDHQIHIEWNLRGVLVDWLVEVHTRFHLLPETIFLAVNIVDRFLSNRIVQLEKLQLVGIAAMFIASKYEEVLSPHVQNFKHVADDGFSEDDILKAERTILETLNYDLSYPNPMNFLRRISKADSYDIQTRTIGKYLLEISLLDHRFIEYRPSHIAAASMYLARLILDRGEWDVTLAHYSGYTEKEIQPVFKLMVDYLHKPVVHEAFFKKYASKKFLKAVSFNNTSAIPLILIESFAATGLLDSLLMSSTDTPNKALHRARSYFLVNATIGDSFTFAMGPKLLDGEETPDKQVKNGDSNPRQEASGADGAAQNDNGQPQEGRNEHANEQTSLLPVHVQRGEVAVARFAEYEGHRIWSHLPLRAQHFLQFAFSFVHAPLIGAAMGLLLGLTPPLHRAFLETRGMVVTFKLGSQTAFRKLVICFQPSRSLLLG